MKDTDQKPTSSFHPTARLKYRISPEGKISEWEKVSSKRRCLGWHRTPIDNNGFRDPIMQALSNEEDTNKRVFLFSAAVLSAEHSRWALQEGRKLWDFIHNGRDAIVASRLAQKEAQSTYGRVSDSVAKVEAEIKGRERLAKADPKTTDEEQMKADRESLNELLKWRKETETKFVASNVARDEAEAPYKEARRVAAYAGNRFPDYMEEVQNAVQRTAEIM